MRSSYEWSMNWIRDLMRDSSKISCELDPFKDGTEYISMIDIIQNIFILS